MLAVDYQAQIVQSLRKGESYSSIWSFSGKDKRIQRPLDLIHSCDALQIRDIAAVLSLSPSRFRHLFKQELELSPGQCLRLVRLDRARRLLTNKGILRLRNAPEFFNPCGPQVLHFR